jgi:ketosteroid isomerase-like protein
MVVQADSTAVEVARAHVQAWNNHDLDTARAALANDVHVTVTTTQPGAPAVDTVGIPDYMVGLEAFVKAVTRGSLEEIAAIGDDRNALLLITVEADFGFGKTTSPGARLYLLDENDKIAAEQVVFFLGS